LEIAAEYATAHAESAQARYAAAYNKRAHNKTFAVGDQVVFLSPDSTKKICSRWQPGTIAHVNTPHSYLVDLPNGARRHVHVNKLRPFIARVNAVICESDVDFGRVVAAPQVSSHDGVLPSQRIDSASINHLSVEQQKQLLDLLDSYSVCFSDKPGFCPIIEHDIEMMDGFKPKQSKPYKLPEALQPQVEQQIEDLLAQGVTTKSTSTMTSPIVCVLKSDKKSIRLAVDYRYVNKYTKPDPFPMPDTDHVMSALGNANYISVFDCTSGFWQLGVKESCRWLTAFVTHQGVFEFTRNPFGLRNSGSKFVRAMTEVLKPVNQFCVAFVDDVGVGSQSWSQHLEHLRKFLQVIKASGLTLKLGKSEFARPKVKFVGHLVGSGTKCQDPDKVAAVREMERPYTRQQLRQKLGMLGYYRSFVSHYADIAKPLTDLTSSKTPKLLPWG
jgi:hypothetical protein